MSKIPDVLILVALLLTGVAIGYAARLGRADSDKPVEPHTTVEVQLMLLFPSTTPDDRLKLKHALGAPAVGKLFGKFHRPILRKKFPGFDAELIDRLADTLQPDTVAGFAMELGIEQFVEKVPAEAKP